MFYTYIVASKRNGTIYTGSTDDIIKRIYEHREKVRKGFTAKYGVSILVWYEQHGARETAFAANARSRSGGGRGSCG